jgi:hypothetical protein
MDQERDDYADRDLPPPRRWTREANLNLLLLIAAVAFVFMAVMVFRETSRNPFY